MFNSNIDFFNLDNIKFQILKSEGKKYYFDGECAKYLDKLKHISFNDEYMLKKLEEVRSHIA